MAGYDDRRLDPAALEASDLGAAARAWLTEAAERTDPTARVRATLRAARALLASGRTARALLLLEEARVRACAIGLGPRAEADLLTALAQAATGRAEAALPTAEGALAALDAPGADLAEARLDVAAVRLAAGHSSAAADLLWYKVPTHLAARAAALRALLELAQDRADRAVVALKGAIGAARLTADRVGEAELTGLLGRALVDLRDYGRARPVLEAAVRLAAPTGQARVAAAALGGLGLCRVGAPDTAAALAEGCTLLRRAVLACAEADDPAAEDAWRAHLDDALRALGRHDERARELRRWVEVVGRLGDAEREARLLDELALASRASSDLAGTREALARAEAAWGRLQRPERARAAREQLDQLSATAPLPPPAPR